MQWHDHILIRQRIRRVLSLRMQQCIQAVIDRVLLLLLRTFVFDRHYIVTDEAVQARVVKIHDGVVERGEQILIVVVLVGYVACLMLKHVALMQTTVQRLIVLFVGLSHIVYL